jgi:hypothetical protein
MPDHECVSLCPDIEMTFAAASCSNASVASSTRRVIEHPSIQAASEATPNFAIHKRGDDKATAPKVFARQIIARM